jgi:hypothetical protein
MFHLNSQLASVAAVRLAAVGLATLLAACVAPIPIKDQAPKVAYSASAKVAVVVIDSRPSVKAEGKPATYIGHAHGVFGIPVDMQVYPWVALKEEKNFTLAQELEQRLADALQAIGANVVRVEAGARVDADSARRAAQGQGADRILMITLDQWYVDINLNWVGSFDFDWGYTVEIADKAGVQVAMFKDSGKDVVELHGSDSARNQITAAYRARLEKLLDRPEVRAGLSVSAGIACGASIAGHENPVISRGSCSVPVAGLQRPAEREQRRLGASAGCRTECAL